MVQVDEIRHEESNDFFVSDGSCSMYLSREAAIAVVQECTVRNILVDQIEAGTWVDGGFQPSLDDIWQSIPTWAGISVQVEENFLLDQLLQRSNQDASNFIKCTDARLDTFIVSADAKADYVAGDFVFPE
jgi:hypothetical protein